MPASEIFTFLSMAMAKRKDRSKLRNTAERITKSNLVFGILEIWKKANGKKTRPAEKMRTEAICHPSRAVLLTFMSINELPQIRQSSKKKVQLINEYRFIQFAKVQESIFNL